MSLINWIRFTWDLTRLPQFDPQLPEHYEIGASTAEDEKELRKVVSSSFVLDPAWNAALAEVMEKIESWLENAFGSSTTNCLVLRHGTRIIGAAVVSYDPAAAVHLTPGPCILMEYRNRGFGTHLLEHSLVKLREVGLTQAIGVAKENTPVAKFLYPKFNSTPSAHDSTPLVAA